MQEPFRGVDRSGAFVRLPLEALVIVLDQLPDGFTEIEWNRAVLRVFTVDLTERTVGAVKFRR